MDIVERLRFDGARCELQFSKGVAGNIEEAATEIARLRAALQRIADEDNDIMGGIAWAALHPERGGNEK